MDHSRLGLGLRTGVFKGSIMSLETEASAGGHCAVKMKAAASEGAQSQLTSHAQ